MGKALQPVPVAAHSVTGLAPPLLQGAGGAVYGPVASGDKPPAAEGTPLPLVSAHDLGKQIPVIREDGGAEVFADQCVRNHLRARAEVPIIQREAVATVIVGTQTANQPLGAAKLPVIHARQFSHCQIPAYSWSAPHRPPIPQWHRRSCQFFRTSSL